MPEATEKPAADIRAPARHPDIVDIDGTPYIYGVGLEEFKKSRPWMKAFYRRLSQFESKTFDIPTSSFKSMEPNLKLKTITAYQAEHEPKTLGLPTRKLLELGDDKLVALLPLLEKLEEKREADRLKKYKYAAVTAIGGAVTAAFLYAASLNYSAHGPIHTAPAVMHTNFSEPKI